MRTSARGMSARVGVPEHRTIGGATGAAQCGNATTGRCHRVSWADMGTQPGAAPRTDLRVSSDVSPRCGARGRTTEDEYTCGDPDVSPRVANSMFNPFPPAEIAVVVRRTRFEIRRPRAHAEGLGGARHCTRGCA
eukprot:591489-Prymnesium_polylepis.1